MKDMDNNDDIKKDIDETETAQEDDGKTAESEADVNITDLSETNEESEQATDEKQWTIEEQVYGEEENVEEQYEDEDEEEKEDEDFGEVGGKLKKAVPYLVGGLLTVVIVAVVACSIFFYAGKKKTDSDGTDAVSVSTDDISSSAQPSGNEVLYLDASGNNVSSDAEDSDTSDSSSTESLASADISTTGSLSTLSKEFLNSEDYIAVTDIIEDYFDAYAGCDLDRILSLVDYNGGTQIEQDELDERAEIVEDYQDFKFYIIEGMDATSYVVYASYNIKFYNIDTPAPTLTRFYMTTSDDGSIHIYNGEVSSKLNAYLNSVNEYDCVTELSESINEALGAACEADETLRTLMDILYGSSEN